ncbi:MAG TPA: tyrosine-type recombinase/integrase [Solirubrobacteraceae bacterium]|nr:tyrosine-type recombinase/integrase [Solirubrobacteraceae bacterium]
MVSQRGADRASPPSAQGRSPTPVGADQLRHAHAVELLHEGISLPLIQRQLGHSHLSTTGTYLQGIDTEEIISTVHARRAPMMHASAGLAL